ncbi:diguanylate cyclase domain-containing protein [Cetobacterium sp. ZOR0034]|uniref:diguanylate cyclase domain-containing protein n=1 Tax=Cetobacterium sp. ZOR0034 TaxID=1339239 RepID=UPI000645ABF1|nr:diguanylate cyclase [Cetobacterium sp. ZOR0034]
MNPFSVEGDIIVIDRFDERWVEAFQENALLRSFFKFSKSISRDNIEFLLLFKDIERSELIRKLEIIKGYVKKIDILDEREITVSIGASIESIANKNELYKAIAESDKSLYKAKNSGRDCIIFEGNKITSS